MHSWLAWTAIAAVTIVLGAVGYQFSIRTLRWVAICIALATAAWFTVYGLMHPVQKPGSLSDVFTEGANTLGSALLGHRVPAPGRVGWLVIVVLLVLGYRGLEAWTLHRQAPSLDISALTSDQQGAGAGAGSNGQTGSQGYDRLVAELKFLLPAVQVRSPAILPGGSRPAGLASIAEASGAPGAGLAGAIIRFFGMVWPNPPRIQVRAWVQWPAGLAGTDEAIRVTVSLADPQSGTSIATKTLAAGTLDAAAAAVAGYVARHIFARDRTVPRWSVSATDGADLAALLRSRQVRGYPELRGDIRGAWDTQIEILKGVGRANLCAGVVRYELAQLYDLTNRHAEALLLHAANREQYPRFYRGRYRLAMSLEMLANPHSMLGEIDMTALKAALEILDRCRVTGGLAEGIGGGYAELPESLRLPLLNGAWKELRATRRYLAWRRIIWASFWRRDERTVLRSYRRRRHRQAFHDGVCVGQLLVAVRKTLAEAKAGGRSRPVRLRHAGTTARIAAAISGDSKGLRKVLRRRPKTARPRPTTTRLRTRLWPWQRSTPSWTAAYNLACAYAALAAGSVLTAEADARTQPVYAVDADAMTDPDYLVKKVVRSLEFVVRNPECEMERPSEWIGNDPDFNWLHYKGNKRFTTFLHNQYKRDYPAEPGQQPTPVGCPALSPLPSPDQTTAFP
jgi:hypothetical protein